MDFEHAGTARTKPKHRRASVKGNTVWISRRRIRGRGGDFRRFPAVVTEDHLIVGADLLDDHGRGDIVLVDEFGVNYGHALGRGEPNASLVVPAAGGLVVSAVAFAAEQAVGLAQREAPDLRALPRGNLVAAPCGKRDKCRSSH